MPKIFAERLAKRHAHKVINLVKYSNFMILKRIWPVGTYLDSLFTVSAGISWRQADRRTVESDTSAGTNTGGD